MTCNLYRSRKEAKDFASAISQCRKPPSIVSLGPTTSIKTSPALTKTQRTAVCFQQITGTRSVYEAFSIPFTMVHWPLSGTIGSSWTMESVKSQEVRKDANMTINSRGGLEELGICNSRLSHAWRSPEAGNRMERFIMDRRHHSTST